jgi:hypothetical protein
MAPEATLPRSDVNVPGDYFSLAGFEVIMHGRFWVLTEAGRSESPEDFEDVRLPMFYLSSVKIRAQSTQDIYPTLPEYLRSPISLSNETASPSITSWRLLAARQALTIFSILICLWVTL